MNTRYRFVAALVSIPAFALSPVAAQNCPIGDDGLAVVPCCAPAQTNLPNFPPFQISGRYCCLFDCQLDADFPVRVQTAHIPVLCDYAVVPLTVIPGAAGAPGWTGIVLAKYARTWFEQPIAGAARRQVWRFLINGDLRPTAGQAPCPLPPHPSTIPETHFHGHLDYACETDPAGNTVFRMAMSLHHLQGCIEHNVFSCVPLGGAAGHPDRSYHLVAPGQFDCTQVAVPNGVLIAEAVRSSRLISSAGYACFGEGRFTQGALRILARDWLCNSAQGGPFSWNHHRLDGGVQCAGAVFNFQCVPTSFPLPPLSEGCAGLPIGRWTLPVGTFPDDRELTTHWGILRFQDPCNPNDPPVSIVQGVSTAGVQGFLFNTAPPLGSRVFVDLQDMIDPGTLSSGLIGPGWGCLYFSKLVWNLNLP